MIRPLKPPKPLPKVTPSVPRDNAAPHQADSKQTNEVESADIGATSDYKYRSREEFRNVTSKQDILRKAAPLDQLPKSAMSSAIGTSVDSPTKKSKFMSPEHWQENAKARSSGKFKYQLSPTVDVNMPEDDTGTGIAPPAGSTLDVTVDRANIYHKIHYGDEWMYITIIMHVVQFSLLLSFGGRALSGFYLGIMVFIVTSVVILLLWSRYCTVKLPRSMDWSYSSMRTPDQETDIVSNSVIYALSLAAILEGAAYALYPSLSATYDEQHARVGMRSYNTLSQILSFGSIVLFGFHKILRPSNRLDPIRTVFEVRASRQNDYYIETKVSTYNVDDDYDAARDRVYLLGRSRWILPI
jgi:hypothetical protein